MTLYWWGLAHIECSLKCQCVFCCKVNLSLQAGLRCAERQSDCFSRRKQLSRDDYCSHTALRCHLIYWPLEKALKSSLKHLKIKLTDMCRFIIFAFRLYMILTEIIRCLNPLLMNLESWSQKPSHMWTHDTVSAIKITYKHNAIIIQWRYIFTFNFLFVK